MIITCFQKKIFYINWVIFFGSEVFPLLSFSFFQLTSDRFFTFYNNHSNLEKMLHFMQCHKLRTWSDVKSSILGIMIMHVINLSKTRKATSLSRSKSDSDAGHWRFTNLEEGLPQITTKHTIHKPLKQQIINNYALSSYCYNDNSCLPIT